MTQSLSNQLHLYSGLRPSMNRGKPYPLYLSHAGEHMDIKQELERLKAQVSEELRDEPTREQKEEAIKWLGYEWDSILKFLRYLDRDTSVDVPDEVRIAYQQGLYAAKLEAVKAKQAATDSGLIRAIR